MSFLAGGSQVAHADVNPTATIQTTTTTNQSTSNPWFYVTESEQIKMPTTDSSNGRGVENNSSNTTANTSKDTGSNLLENNINSLPQQNATASNDKTDLKITGEPDMKITGEPDLSTINSINNSQAHSQSATNPYTLEITNSQAIPSTENINTLVNSFHEDSNAPALTTENFIFKTAEVVNNQIIPGNSLGTYTLTISGESSLTDLQKAELLIPQGYQLVTSRYALPEGIMMDPNGHLYAGNTYYCVPS